MKDIELLPCPFCGSDDIAFTSNGHDYEFVECMACGSSGPVDVGFVATSEAWNARAAVEADRAQRVPDWNAFEQAVQEYVEDYEMIGETEDGRDACYTPNENDKALLLDAFMGFDFSPWLLAATPAPAQQEPDCPRCKGSGEDPEGYFDTSRGPDGGTHDGPCRDCAGTGAAQHQEPPQQERQIAEALRRRGLTLVKTANGYDVLELGHITAQASGPQQERKPMTNAPTEVEKLMDAAGLCRRCAEPTDTRGVKDVLAERQRQIKSEGYSPESDDAYWQNDLVKAAVCYAWPMYPMREGVGEDPHDQRKWAPDLWPWEARHWKPKDRRSNLVRAGALILAEIERLDRVERHHGIKE